MIKEYMSRYEEDFKNCKEYMKSIKTWYKLLPNLLTIARPIGMIPANILFFTGNVIPAVVLTGGLLLTDLFDGKLARKWNVVSKLGADLDAAGDKVMFLGMALPLLANFPTLAVNFLLEAMIAGVNVYGRLNDLETKTVYSGKVKTWFLSFTLLAGYFVQFFNLPMLVLNISMLLTGFSQGVALSDYVSNYEKMEFEKKFNTMLNQYVGDKESDKEESNERTKLLNDLRREKSFYLGMLEPNKVYKGKKRARLLLQEKRNILN